MTLRHVTSGCMTDVTSDGHMTLRHGFHPPPSWKRHCSPVSPATHWSEPFTEKPLSSSFLWPRCSNCDFFTCLLHVLCVCTKKTTTTLAQRKTTVKINDSSQVTGALGTSRQQQTKRVAPQQSTGMMGNCFCTAHRAALPSGEAFTNYEIPEQNKWFSTNKSTFFLLLCVISFYPSIGNIFTSWTKLFWQVTNPEAKRTVDKRTVLDRAPHFVTAGNKMQEVIHAKI